MNFKKIFLLFCAFFVIGFSACTKRDKLLNNAMILQIEPAADISLGIGDTQSLTAIIKNINFEEVSYGVRWSVSNSDLGSFSDTTSKSTVFTAEVSGTGKIILTCEGYSVSVNITVS